MPSSQHHRAKEVKSAASAEDSGFPMRINKYLAHQGHATRRDADTLVEKKMVFINGTLAKLGDRVKESDTVEVRGRTPRSYTYLAFHKPKDVATLSEDKNEKDVLSYLTSDLKRLRLFPLGRLDKASSGLLLLTNDGRLTDRLLNPVYDHEKTYDVTTKMPLRASFKEYMERGIDIEGYITRPAQVEVLGEKRFRITLTEGKKHQIRRMVVAMRNEVEDLKRVRVMNVELGKLPVGVYRPIEKKELETLLTSLGL